MVLLHTSLSFTIQNISIFSIKRSNILRRSLSYSHVNFSSSSSSMTSPLTNNKKLATNIANTMSEINRDNFLSNMSHRKDKLATVSNIVKNDNTLYHNSVDNNRKVNSDKNKQGRGTNNDHSNNNNNNNNNNNSNSNSNSNDGNSNDNKPVARYETIIGSEDTIRMESFFDSYKVVQEFKNSGFTDQQSLLLMRYTYFILQEKLNWLSQTYSPKVDLENEAYLFEAAHSELLFEVTNSREISLMNLTNGMIILKRGFNNLEDETLAQIKLNDDIIKMELNQFKHENNLHQKSLNLKNSDLNSRILSDMVSGLRSETETFRWQLTRAGILSIMIMAICIMGIWNVTKRLTIEEEGDYKGPLLTPVHEQTDEESHDYEADWDERVTV